MNKNEKKILANAVSANAATEQDRKGQEFLDSFTAENIFEEVKKIIREHIPEDMISFLDNWPYCNITFHKNRICQIWFAFGGALNGYYVVLNAHDLTITPRNPVSCKKVVYSCPTCDLTKK